MVVVWQVNATAVFKDWFDQGLNHAQRQAVRVVVDLLAERGPGLGRPYADRVHGSRYHNMKELRPRGSAARNIRILFVFDPERQALLLLGGDKTGKWSVWYRR
ncbi:MAG: type II toxin-antitoxin system RelE/ParE family toxin, partial [bacterium]|nr:type II toxin-antitoxin system RelE/ParE family toxin [bacterium]